MFIYWMWGRSEIGIVLANTETEARKKIINYYKLTDNLALFFGKRTVEEMIFLEEVNEFDDVVEVYS